MHVGPINIFYKAADNPISFTLKLMGFIFSRQEMASSNFAGGFVARGDTKIYKLPLDKIRLQAIMEEAWSQYPGKLVNASQIRLLRDAINGKCRHTKVNE